MVVAQLTDHSSSGQNGSQFEVGIDRLWYNTFHLANSRLEALQENMCPTFSWLTAVKSDISRTWDGKFPLDKPRGFLELIWKIVLIIGKILISPLRGHFIKSKRNGTRTRAIEAMLFWFNIRAEIIGEEIAARLGTVAYSNKATCRQRAHVLCLATQNLIRCESEVKRQTHLLTQDLGARAYLLDRDIEGHLQKIYETYVRVVAEQVDREITAAVNRINQIRTFKRIKMHPHLANLCNQLSVLSRGVQSETVLLKAIEVFYGDAATLYLFAREENMSIKNLFLEEQSFMRRDWSKILDQLARARDFMNDLFLDFKAFAQEEEQVVHLEAGYIALLQRQKYLALTVDERFEATWTWWERVTADIKAGENEVRIFQDVVVKPKVTLSEIGQNLLKIVVGDNSDIRAGSPTLTSALLDSLDRQIVSRDALQETVLDQLSADLGVKKASVYACVGELSPPHMPQKWHDIEEYRINLKKYEILKNLNLLKRFCSKTGLYYLYKIRRRLALLPE